MKRSRSGRTPKDDWEDGVRRDYATATVTARQLVDAITAIFAGEAELDRDQLRRFHAGVNDLHRIVFANTVCHLVPEDFNDREQPEAQIDRYHDTYSDGHPVSEIRPKDVSDGNLVNPCFFDGDIPWFPNTTVEWPADLDRAHWRTGPPPTGWEVFVNPPPAVRRRRLQCVRSPEEIEAERLKFESLRAFFESERTP